MDEFNDVAVESKPKSKDDMYIHLSNGDVVRVPASEVPVSAGHDAPYGYYHDGAFLHLVTGVYPVEIECERD